MATLRPSPVLRRRDERPPDTAATRSRHNEPSLEIRHAIPLTSLGVRANRELGKTDRTPCPVLGQKSSERLLRVAGEEPGDRFPMFRLGAVRPQGVTQFEPRGRVARRRGSNSDHRSSRALLRRRSAKSSRSCVSASSRCRPCTTCSSASSCAVTSADGASGRVARIRAILTAAIATIATIGMSGVRSMASLFPQELVLTKERPHLTRGVDAVAGGSDPPLRQRLATRPGVAASLNGIERSEEHTSELQSRLHLVCRLLLEKKKTTQETHSRTR